MIDLSGLEFSVALFWASTFGMPSFTFRDVDVFLEYVELGLDTTAIHVTIRVRE